ncbi:hypothetical protein SEUCBS140593_008815 [Sporothrix eucalyptigena]|uniref:NmrA-like domain-containing protein n=1 Tax=Sporothrix eucalyptigena TaxID=1812306 RepID=A0ABP0CPR1_9PEZI
MTRLFVAGVTGCQGSAVVQQALKKGWSVQGLARNPESAAAVALAAQGVQLTPGDYDNAEALQTAMAGCTAAFIALMPKFDDPSAEERWAGLILGAARTAGVQTVVASTGLNADNPDQLDGWQEGSFFSKIMQSKRNIEAAVREAGFPNWTVLRPGFFMANFILPKVAMYPGFSQSGVWSTALLAETQLPLIDDLDIGAFAVEAVARPVDFSGKTIPIAFDVRTPGMIVQTLSAATGRRLEAKFQDEEEVKKALASDLFVAGYYAMRNMIKLIDIDALKAYGIPMGTLEQYIQRHIDNAKKTFESAPLKGSGGKREE